MSTGCLFFILTCPIGERYVYKFVCDPEALFQMALAENHRNALKAEAASVLAKTAAVAAATTAATATEVMTAASAEEEKQQQQQQLRSRHQYSDMLNQARRKWKQK